jgi:hypothetical protein
MPKYLVTVQCRVFVEAENRAEAVERAFSVTENIADHFNEPGQRAVVLDQSIGLDNDDVKVVDKDPVELWSGDTHPDDEPAEFSNYQE